MVTNEIELTSIESNVRQLKEWVMEMDNQNKEIPLAGVNISVSPTSQQMTDGRTRCNDLLIRIQADVFALETI